MARPTKQGIDYFPLDCQFDDKIEMFLIEKGSSGLGVLVTIWQMIYSNNGYYINNNGDLHLLIKQKIDVGINDVFDCINVCLRRGIFDQKVFKKHKILTSKAIQKRYFEAAKKKKSVQIITTYLLIPIDSYHNLVNSDENLVNDDGKTAKEKEEVKVKEKEVIAYLNERADKSFKPVESNTRLITARFDDGYTVDDILRVIDIKVSQWKNNEKMNQYLRPATLFCPKNFNQYAGEKSEHATEAWAGAI